MEVKTWEHLTRIHIVEITGRLDAFNVSTLRDEQTRLLAEGGRHFIIDLRDMTFMDSAGLSALVGLLKRARQIGGDVALIKPADPLADRVLTLTRFDQVFLIGADVEDARRKLKA